MTITVDLLSPSRAVVVLEPSLLRRMLFGDKAETLNAEHTWAGWQFIERRAMTPRIEDELEHARMTKRSTR